MMGNVLLTRSGVLPILGDDVKLIMSSDGNTYFVFDSATQKLQLWVKNVKRSEWR